MGVPVRGAVRESQWEAQYLPPELRVLFVYTDLVGGRVVVRRLLHAARSDDREVQPAVDERHLCRALVVQHVPARSPPWLTFCRELQPLPGRPHPGAYQKRLRTEAGHPNAPVPSDDTMTKCSTPHALAASTRFFPPWPSMRFGSELSSGWLSGAPMALTTI